MSSPFKVYRNNKRGVRIELFDNVDGDFFPKLGVFAVFSGGGFPPDGVGVETSHKTPRSIIGDYVESGGNQRLCGKAEDYVLDWYAPNR